MGRDPHHQAAAGTVAEKEVDTMNEFYTMKALLNVWRQLGMKTSPSSSKSPIISASRFRPIGCAYVYFSYQPLCDLFNVSITYYKEGNRIEKNCMTDDFRKAMKAAYLYSEELDTL